MTLSVNAKTYTGDSYSTNKVGYNGPAKTGSIQDNLTLGRTDPKPTATFSGMSRTSCRLVRTHTLTGALTPMANSSVSFDVAIPVGTPAADIDAILNDLGAFIASATFKTHVKTPQVAF